MAFDLDSILTPLSNEANTGYMNINFEKTFKQMVPWWARAISWEYQMQLKEVDNGLQRLRTQKDENARGPEWYTMYGAQLAQGLDVIADTGNYFVGLANWANNLCSLGSIFRGVLDKIGLSTTPGELRRGDVTLREYINSGTSMLKDTVLTDYSFFAQSQNDAVEFGFMDNYLNTHINNKPADGYRAFENLANAGFAMVVHPMYDSLQRSAGIPVQGTYHP